MADSPMCRQEQLAEALLRRLFQGGSSSRAPSKPETAAYRHYSNYTADLENCAFADAGAIKGLLGARLLLNVPFPMQECVFRYLTHSVIQHVCNQEAAKEVNTLGMVLGLLECIADRQMGNAPDSSSKADPVDLAVMVSVMCW